jgi:hypothetical protein
MPEICLDRIGIMPAGALGVSFYYHLSAGGSEDTGITFLDRPGGGDSSRLRWADSLQIEVDGMIRRVACAQCFSGGLIESYEAGILPELILVGTNADQLDDVLRGLRLLLEWMGDEGRLDARSITFPYLLFVANGIYFNRLRYRFVELLELAMMEGLLPDLWPHVMPALVSHLLRGTTLVLGQRTGRGAEAIYHPGSKGLTTISGGNPASRKRVRKMLFMRGLPVESDNRPPVHAELQKALLLLIGNVLGAIFSVTPDGRYSPLRVKEIYTREHEGEILILGEHVYIIGHAIGAIPAERAFATDWPILLEQRRTNEHRPSTLQWIARTLSSGAPCPAMTPNEDWLLTPLEQMAKDMGLKDTFAYFQDLEARYRAMLAMLNERL